MPTFNTPDNYSAPDLEHSHWPNWWDWPDKRQSQSQSQPQGQGQSQPTTKEKTDNDKTNS